MFNELYKLGEAQALQCDGTLYACAASNGEKAAVILTNDCDDNDTPAAETMLTISGFACENGVKAKYSLLDDEHDLSLVREEQFRGDSFSSVLTVPLYSSCLVIFEKI